MAGTPPPENKSIQVVIDAAGHYRVNERALPDNRRDTIQQALRNAAGGQREPTIEIDADRNATHQAVFTFLKAATEAGYGNLTFPYLSEPDSNP
jgi:biopolymer transport protein ExbD